MREVNCSMHYCSLCLALQLPTWCPHGTLCRGFIGSMEERVAMSRESLFDWSPYVIGGVPCYVSQDPVGISDGV